jgi:hypothetical protein
MSEFFYLGVQECENPFSMKRRIPYSVFSPGVLISDIVEGVTTELHASWQATLDLQNALK